MQSWRDHERRTLTVAEWAFGFIICGLIVLLILLHFLNQDQAIPH
jgi:hypothetical protein